MKTPAAGTLATLIVLAISAPSATGDDLDEFRVKRQEDYAFTQPPTLNHAGDNTTIRFATQAYCDVTVAIEDSRGRIVRHLASGALGDNAPPPLVKDSLQQAIVWDGKDDQGRYLDDRQDLVARVSLGLQPNFERNLYSSPYKRIGEAAPVIRAAPEGVYVYDGKGIDHVRLYDHQGNYLRTVHPFPADKLADVRGLNRQEFPQSGQTLPIKNSLYQQTLLTSGDNASRDDRGGMTGTAASAMAIHGDRIALVKQRFNRLATDGSTGGRDLTGPSTTVALENFKVRYKRDTVHIPPTSAALSPDGRWLYLAGYAYRYSMNFDCLSTVLRVPYAEDGPLESFAGGMKVGEFGEGDRELSVATSVDVDDAGRVYVADYMNDRVQVFSPDGELLKSIATFKPAQLRVHHRTGELYVFSWLVCNNLMYARGRAGTKTIIDAKLTRFGTFDDPVRLAEYDLPLPQFKGRYSTYTGIAHALLYNGEIDSWTDPPTVWLGRDCLQNIERGVHPGDGGRRTPWDQAGIQLLRPGLENKLEVVRDFGQDVTEDELVVRARPPSNAIQRLIVNPVTGHLFVGEADSGATVKAFKQLLEIDPETGRVSVIELPFNALEAAFDLDGMIYLRTTNVIVRYDPRTWQEVPFDYGEELPQVGCGMYGRFAKVQSGLVMPSNSPVCFHQGGIHVSPAGNIIASCAYRYSGEERPRTQVIRTDLGGAEQIFGKPYTPRVFPGRVFSSTGAALHIWDKHGQVLYEDAIPGLPQVDGVGLDRDNNIYIMATPTRVHDGEKHFNEMSETLARFRPQTGKVLGANSRAPVPLSPQGRPARPPEWHNSTLKDGWADGAAWHYGGVGFAGFNSSRAGGGCACWFARYALDHFARSIAPEPLHFSVAVVDSAGNLITRVGRYGNLDSAGPDSRVPLGGDEVGLFHACYTGTHTDRRLFISDVGNGRIVSVKLDYHVTERIPLTRRTTNTE